MKLELGGAPIFSEIFFFDFISLVHAIVNASIYPQDGQKSKRLLNFLGIWIYFHWF